MVIEGISSNVIPRLLDTNTGLAMKLQHNGNDALEKEASKPESTNGHDLKLIQHKHRYSDLMKYLYSPKRLLHFKGFPKPVGLPPFGLDDASDMRFLHPVTSLVDRPRGIPEDWTLEPRDCLNLWRLVRY